MTGSLTTAADADGNVRYASVGEGCFAGFSPDDKFNMIL
jgi:hypothetical protein